jgi:hypothetical protein
MAKGDTMTVQNQFTGYVATPETKLSQHPIRLDFNSRIEGHPEGARLGAYNLRMFVPKAELGGPSVEIGISLTAEQWLDLVDAMKQEFIRTENDRREWDQRFGVK